MSVELFRYRGAARDGRTLEYVFEAGEQNSPNAVTKEKAAEFAADFMTTFEKIADLGAQREQAVRNQSSAIATRANEFVSYGVAENAFKVARAVFEKAQDAMLNAQGVLANLIPGGDLLQIGASLTQRARYTIPGMGPCRIQLCRKSRTRPRSLPTCLGGRSTGCR